MTIIKTTQLRIRGSALPLALVAILILLTVGASVLSLGLNSRIFSIRNASGISARCAADAGLTKALYEMNQKLQGTSWLGYDLPCETNTYLSNCDAYYNYIVTGNPISGYSIESTGTSGQNTKKVSCSLKLQGPFEAAIFTKNGITLYNSAEVEGYNYGEDEKKLKIGTNSTQLRAITLKSSATVDGDVVVGIGGNPSDVIDNNGTITGQTGTLPQEYDMPSITVPDWLLSLPSSGAIKNGTTIYSPAKYDSIDLNSGETITIDGNIIIYVSGEMILKNSSELRIGEDASLTIYLGGNFEGKNSSNINNSTKIPKNLKIYGLDSCESMIFHNSSDLYGTIYAPNANIEMDNSADVYGSVITKSFDQKNSANFKYDASLRDVTINDEAVYFVVTEWHEY
jgi:hypothetical protein